MSYISNEYTYVNSYHEGKKGYVDKFEKSIKLPFLNVMSNHMPNTKPPSDDVKIDESDVAVSDHVEIRTAVAGASAADSPDTGDATYA